MNYKLIINFFSLLLVVLYLITSSCAKIGAISGGPKDTIPPQLVSSVPKNYTLNFSGHKIQLNFDEFIQLKDVNQQLNVSPPLKKKPQVKLKGKSAFIEFSDTLKENTTYTFNFGNAIVDNNEGNILRNFEFVFSTGSFLDSMGVEGQIINAFILKPDKESLLAMLYQDLSDSAPYKQIPIYTSRTDKNGHYFINHVKEGTYRLYALKDGNYNYKYDPPTEEFGFADTLIYLHKQMFDSLLCDTSHGINPKLLEKVQPSDTSRKDSLKTNNKEYVLHVDLVTFKEKDPKQYIKDYSRKDKHCLDFDFNRSLLDDSLEFFPVYYKAENWYQLEKNLNNDTFKIWITDTSLIKTDTLRIKIFYTGTDKKNNPVSANEILNFRYFSKESGKKKGKKQPSLPLVMKPSNNSILDLNQDISILSQYPVYKVDSDKIILFLKVDTVENPQTFHILKDTTNKRLFFITFKREEENRFKLQLLPGAFQDIYGNTNDTITSSFNIQKADFYGNLFVILSGVRTHMLVQLFDKETLVKQTSIDSDGKVEFNYLYPKKYTVKFIYDTNHNDKWDTGNFHEKKQPEKVEFYKEDVNIRSNWDVQISWDLKGN
jgi:hypothetical protein